MSFALKVIWNDGEEEYLKEGISTVPALFSSRKTAQDQREFMLVGMDGDCQSINIVNYPKEKK